ncbi:MAG TPA: FAD:protein FMN transferase [Rhodocyclaceae bacterium]
MRLLKACLLAALALLLAACGRDPLVSRESYVFGTRVQVLVWGEPESRATAAIDTVLREFDRLHRTYHAWQSSDLTEVNLAIAEGRSIEVAPEMAALIRRAQELAEQGEYLFDPGVGNLVKLWGFHDDSFRAQLPDAKSLAALKVAHPSIAALKLDGRTVSGSNRTVALDFGGYLKGVALDRAAAALRGRGIQNALINIGGNIYALGSKGGTPWRVGLQHPRGAAPLASLELRDGEAIGTSGDYQRYFEIDGQRYCHLIDPRSGEPSRASQALTILIPPGPEAGMLSDAESKPLFIAGDDWLRLAHKLGITQALRVDANGRVQVTAALKARLKFEVPDLKIEEVR